MAFVQLTREDGVLVSVDPLQVTAVVGVAGNASLSVVYGGTTRSLVVQGSVPAVVVALGLMTGFVAFTSALTPLQLVGVRASTVQQVIEVSPTECDLLTAPDDDARFRVLSTFAAANASLSAALVTDAVAASGYVPTMSNEVNVASSTAQFAMWSSVFDASNVGTVVTVSGTIAFTPTAAAIVEFDIDTPVPSAFTFPTAAAGTCIGTEPAGDVCFGQVTAGAADRLHFRIHSCDVLDEYTLSWSAQFTVLV